MNARLRVRLLQPQAKPSPRVATSMSVLEAMRLAVKWRDPVMAYAIYKVGHKWVEAGIDKGES